MTKVSRTFRIDPKLSTALDIIHTRSGDYTWHVEAALSQYGPIKDVLGGSVAVVKKKAVAAPVDNSEFEQIWAMYGRKGNGKTARIRFNNLPAPTKQLVFNHVPDYVLSTPEKKYRKGFESYLNLECWNDEIVQSTGGNEKKSLMVGLTDRSWADLPIEDEALEHKP